MSKVITGKVRFSYANVFVPTLAPGATDEKYSVAILIDKTDKATLDKVEKAIQEQLEVFKSKNAGKVPKNFKYPLRDGDEDREDDPVYAGKMFFNASSKTKPGIVDENREAIMSNDEFYSGCYGRASVNFYNFSVNGNTGIAVGLNNLQKLEDGERLAGGASAEEDFADENDLD